jgi:hypothetical protein
MILDHSLEWDTNLLGLTEAAGLPKYQQGMVTPAVFLWNVMIMRWFEIDTLLFDIVFNVIPITPIYAVIGDKVGT